MRTRITLNTDTFDAVTISGQITQSLKACSWKARGCRLEIHIRANLLNRIKKHTLKNGIHHWRSLWSNYKKLAWAEFDPTITEYRSDALTDCTIRPWVQLALRSNFLLLLQFHCLFSVKFHFGYCLHQSPPFF